jgi:hypothetical protein
MRAGIDDRVVFETVRQINVRAGIAETELHNAHPRHSQTLTQRMHLGSNKSQIFGNEGQLSSQRVAKGVK